MKTYIDKTEINAKKNLNIKIIVISDIHDDGKKIRINLYENTIKKISKYKPNYILIPGDIVQSENFSEKNITNFIINLSKISPVVISLGNHELEAEKKGKKRDWYTSLKKYKNIYPLDNNEKTINGIQFIGFNPSLEIYKKINRKKVEKEFLKQINEENIKINNKSKYIISLIHSPLFLTDETINNSILKETDLIICGHMHNGLAPKNIEFFLKDKGVFGPYYNLLPKYCRGLIKISNKNVFISKGFRKITMENKLANLIDEKFFTSNIHEIIIK